MLRDRMSRCRILVLGQMTDWSPAPGPSSGAAIRPSSRSNSHAPNRLTAKGSKVMRRAGCRRCRAVRRCRRLGGYGRTSLIQNDLKLTGRELLAIAQAAATPPLQITRLGLCCIFTGWPGPPGCP